MKTTNDTIACFVDHGLFLHVALCCAEQYKHVYYTGPSDEVMEKVKDSFVGDGFENITRVKSLWDAKDKCDIFVFPDIGFSGEQKELVLQGFPVWGHHGADELEVMKGLFLNTLEELDMEVPSYTTVRGIDALKSMLWDEQDKWVKVSRYRGDWETFHWRNRVMDEQVLDCHAYKLGPLKNKLLFYVFDKIDTTIEDGIDSWCINGKWPKTILHAMEKKDKSLIGAMQNMSDVQEEIRGVNEKFGPVLARYGYQGAFSTECRMTEDKTYFIDPTCRFGSPPSQLQTVLIKNLPTVILAGAHGEVEEPEFGDEPIGAQVLITTDREKDDWLTFQMPGNLRPFVKSAFACEIDNEVQICPNPLENWAGWLVAIGKTVKEVIDTLKERCELLPDGFECDLTSLCDLLKELEDAKDEGVEITEQEIPEPASIIEA